MPEAQIGPAVLKTLFEMFGDTARIEQAMQRAIPDLEKVESMRGELEDLKGKRREVLQQRERLIQLAAEGVVEKDEVSKRKSKLARSVLVDALKHPSPKAIAKILDAPFERQRKIIENAFAGKEREGRRLGVYIEPTDDPERPWKFEIRAVPDQVVTFLLPKDSGQDEATKGSFSWY